MQHESRDWSPTSRNKTPNDSCSTSSSISQNRSREHYRRHSKSPKRRSVSRHSKTSKARKKSPYLLRSACKNKCERSKCRQSSTKSSSQKTTNSSSKHQDRTSDLSFITTTECSRTETLMSNQPSSQISSLRTLSNTATLDTKDSESRRQYTANSEISSGATGYLSERTERARGNLMSETCSSNSRSSLFDEFSAFEVGQKPRSASRSRSRSQTRMLKVVSCMETPIFIRSSQKSTIVPSEKEIQIESTIVLVANGMNEEERKREMKELFQVKCPTVLSESSNPKGRDLKLNTINTVLVGRKVIVVKTQTVVQRSGSEETSSNFVVHEYSQICPYQANNQENGFLSIQICQGITVNKGVYRTRENILFSFGTKSRDSEQMLRECRRICEEEINSESLDKGSKLIHMDENLEIEGRNLSVMRDTRIYTSERGNAQIWRQRLDGFCESIKNYEVGEKDGNFTVKTTKVRNGESGCVLENIDPKSGEILPKQEDEFTTSLVDISNSVEKLEISDKQIKADLPEENIPNKEFSPIRTEVSLLDQSPVLSELPASISDIKIQKTTQTVLQSSKEQKSTKNVDLLETVPTSYLVFNGPFDMPHTYVLQLTNSSLKPIAWCSKTNKISRIRLRPSFGKIAPQKSIMVTVTCISFKYDAQRTEAARHRISILWKQILANDTFSRQLFNSESSTQRKNIKILYNP